MKRNVGIHGAANLSKSWKRTKTWLGVMVVALGVLAAAILAVHLYMTGTATALHPEPTRVDSVAHSDPARQWADAVERSRQIVRVSLSEQNLPGLSVAVGAGGDVVWAEGFGWSDLENRAPVSPGTLFRIGTASVVLTSAAAGLLLENSRLDLDEEIQTYVPTFPKKEWPVTVRQLMGHVAGVRTDSGDEGPLFSRQCGRPADAVRVFADRSLLFEPGNEYRRSSYGWILVSAAIEAAAGEPFLRFMQTQIFDPLGMNDTRAESATEPIRDRAIFYFPRYAADPQHGLHVMREIDYSCYAGASVFLSTPSDLVHFGMAVNSGRLLQPSTVQLLQTSQRVTSGKATGYGLGWDLERLTLAGEPTRMAGHNGESLGGMVASLLTFPQHGIVVSVTSNISYANTFDVALEIAHVFARGRPDSR